MQLKIEINNNIKIKVKKDGAVQKDEWTASLILYF